MQVPFYWPDYLKEVKAQAAPASCFKQCTVPPENEFTIGTFILHLNNLNTPSALFSRSLGQWKSNKKIQTLN
jgi:hypothetical protein